MLSLSSPAHSAPSVVCEEGNWPCASQSEVAVVQLVNPIFRVQLRVSQSENFIAGGIFPEVFATLRTPQGTSCEERFTNVEVRQSVLNIEVGRNMNCSLGDFIRENDNLFLELCLGNQEACFSTPIASVPYAVKATHARRAELAAMVNRTQQAHYAHRLASDIRQLDNFDEISPGFLDFHTRQWTGILAQAFGYRGEAQPAARGAFREGGGFIIWTPADGLPITRFAFKLLAAGAEVGAALTEIILRSDRTLLKGALTVEGNPAAAEGTPAAEITGYSHFVREPAEPDPAQGIVTVERSVTVSEGDVAIDGDADLAGALTVGGETRVRKGAEVAGPVQVTGDILVRGTMRGAQQLLGNNDGLVRGTGSLAGSLEVTGQARVQGNLNAGATEITTEALVESGQSRLNNGLSTAVGLQLVGSLGGTPRVQVTRQEVIEEGRKESQLSLYMGAELEAPGEVVFRGQVEFAGGVTPPTDQVDCVISNRIEVIRKTAEGTSVNDNIPGVYRITCGETSVNLSQFRRIECGNGRTEAEEACDDGDPDNGDGCDTNCTFTACGNSIVTEGEECDDGNDEQGDGCSRDCTLNDRCKSPLDAEHEISESAILELNLFEAPPRESCSAEGDEDGDGLADCDDPDCFEDPACDGFPFSGVQRNRPVADLTNDNFVLCHQSAYNTSTPLDELLESCSGGQVVVGCRPIGVANLTLAAAGEFDEVFRDVGNAVDTTNRHNGVEWYYSRERSWGFAPEGAAVNRNSCDYGGADPHLRMCVHTSGGMTQSGYRCGNNDLNGNAAWERVVYKKVLGAGAGVEVDERVDIDENLNESSVISPNCRGGGSQDVLRLLIPSDRRGHQQSHVLFEVIESNFDTTLHLRERCDDQESLACDDDGGEGLKSLIRVNNWAHSVPLYLLLDSFDARVLRERDPQRTAKVAVHVRCPELEPLRVLRSSSSSADPRNLSADFVESEGRKEARIHFNTVDGSLDHPVAFCRSDVTPDNSFQQVIELVLEERQQVSVRTENLSEDYLSYVYIKRSCTAPTAILCGGAGEELGSALISDQLLEPGVYHIFLTGTDNRVGSATALITLTPPPPPPAP